MAQLLRTALLVILAQQTCRVKGQGLAVLQETRQPLCHWPCSCGPRPQCPPGVSMVLDGCGCCKACARQAGESCDERNICDPHKSMYCDFSADRPRFQFGICAYMLAVGCELNGIHYDNGHSFQPSPLYKCVCIAGAIGCSPAFTQKPASLLGPAPLRAATDAGKHQQDTSYWAKPAYRDHPLAWKKSCLVQTTPWSPCSRTCGIGISVRVSNDNGKCEMRKDRRLCQLRPCDKTILRSLKMPKGKTCCPKFQAKAAEKLKLSGCTSTLRYQPTYCGVCSDKRCCVPNGSRTVSVQFSCVAGRGKGGAGAGAGARTTVRWKMQWITSCVCQRSCNKPEDMFSELHFL